MSMPTCHDLKLTFIVRDLILAGKVTIDWNRSIIPEGSCS